MDGLESAPVSRVSSPHTSDSVHSPEVVTTPDLQLNMSCHVMSPPKKAKFSNNGESLVLETNLSNCMMLIIFRRQTCRNSDKWCPGEIDP